MDRELKEPSELSQTHCLILTLFKFQVLASMLRRFPVGLGNTPRSFLYFTFLSWYYQAPFVAGQMDYCMDNTAVFLPVLVGFNPVSMAR